MGRNSGDPLATVVLTRQPKDNAALKGRLTAAGFDVIERPCVEIVWRAPDEDEVRRLAEQPPAALIFASQNAVTGFFHWRSQLPGPARPARPRLVGAVGPHTASVLREHGWEADVVAEPATGEELAARLVPLLEPGETVCAVRGDTSRDASREPLLSTGMRVSSVTVYGNRAPDIAPLDTPADVVVFASPSAARRFLAAHPHAASWRAVAIGSTTAQWLSEATGQTPVVADATDTDALFDAITRAVSDAHAPATCPSAPPDDRGKIMSMRYQQSEALYHRACQAIPGGVNSPVRAFRSVGGSPVFVARGEGAEILDADGNRYVDFCGSWGPLLLGHARAEVVEAATEALRDGLTFGACCEREIRLAEAVLSAFPEYDRARFVNSGTEAVMTAIRLARGITGRRKIVKFDGCYHGHADHLLVKAGSGLLTQSIGSSKGVPDSFAEQTLVASLDDEDGVTRLFDAFGDDIAAVILEPLPANSGLLVQRPEFLKFLREITTRSGALLIFDEVISGFRLCFGGYMHRVGITPDLVTLGKIVGGGMPVGALVGPHDLMERLAPTGDVYQAGTLSGNPVAMAAGAATLDILSRPETYRYLDELGAVQDETLAALARTRPEVRGVRVGSISWLYLDTATEIPRRVDRVAEAAIARYNGIHRAMLDRGYYLAPSAWEVAFLSTAHTPEQIRGLAAALGEVL